MESSQQQRFDSNSGENDVLKENPEKTESITTERLYNDNRYVELQSAEAGNLRRFSETHLEQFHSESACTPRKLRPVCKKPRLKQKFGIDALVKRLRKAAYRQINNERSQESRSKRKMASINDTLMAIFLRDR